MKSEGKEAMKNKNMKEAKRLMIKKKKYIAEIGKLNGQKKLVERQNFVIEGGIQNNDVIRVIDAGVKAEEVLAKGANINKFDELKHKHDDLEEGNNEINDFFIDYDNEDEYEDCDEDLAELEAELKAEEKMKNIEDKPVIDGKVKTKYGLINII